MGALCFLNGFSKAIEEDLLIKSGHLRVINKKYLKKQRVLSLRSAVVGAPALAGKIRELPNIRDVREQIVFGATIDTDGEHQYPLIITGFDVQRAGLYERLKQCLYKGEVASLANPRDKKAGRIVLGRDAAQRLGNVKVGQLLVILATGRHGSLCARDFILTAIVDMEAPNLDLMGYAPLSDVRWLLDMNNTATDIIIYANSAKGLRTLAKQVRSICKDQSLVVQPWYDVGGVGAFINSHYRLGGLVALLILFVAAVCVSNTMIMTILERRGEMGLLAALGFDRWQVVALFQAESFLIALIGVLPGTLIGLAVCYYFETVGIYWGNFTAFPLRSVAYGKLEFSVWLWAVAVGCGTAVAAGFWPILQKTKLKPSEALRCV